MIAITLTCDWSVVLVGHTASSTNKTDHHDITEILLKVALNTTDQTNQPLHYVLLNWNLNYRQLVPFQDHL